MSDKVHKFEAAGLGLAPFAFIGVETAADRAAIQSERAGSGMIYTTNNSTSCDYCGQGIQNAFRVRSADGKTFKVGCECIRKSDDGGLIRVVKDEESKKRRAAAKARNEKKWKRERDLVAAFRAGGGESLRSLPHPKGRDGSAFDYVRWCLDNKCYGETVLKIIEDAIAVVPVAS